MRRWSCLEDSARSFRSSYLVPPSRGTDKTLCLFRAEWRNSADKRTDRERLNSMQKLSIVKTGQIGKYTGEYNKERCDVSRKRGWSIPCRNGGYSWLKHADIEPAENQYPIYSSGFSEGASQLAMCSGASCDGLTWRGLAWSCAC